MFPLKGGMSRSDKGVHPHYYHPAIPAGTTHLRLKVIPHNSARETDERICVRKRWKTAGILCVLQGFPNAFLAERIRQNPKTQLCGVALEMEEFS